MSCRLAQFMQSLILVGIILLANLAPASAATISGPAPNFTLKSLSGKNLKLSEMTGNVVLINFWASWCPACRQETPENEKLHQLLGLWDSTEWQYTSFSTF